MLYLILAGASIVAGIFGAKSFSTSAKKEKYIAIRELDDKEQYTVLNNEMKSKVYFSLAMLFIATSYLIINLKKFKKAL